MAKYIIAVHDYAQTDYICSGTYMFQHEKYVVLTERRNEAKRYSSERRAKAAIETLLRSCVNLTREYEIIEVDDE